MKEYIRIIVRKNLDESRLFECIEAEVIQHIDYSDIAESICDRFDITEMAVEEAYESLC